MKQQFKSMKFKASTRHLIATANEIIEEYQNDGLTLTLRQLYYQFVSRNYLPNEQRAYNNLGKAISNGRMAGLIDWRAIEDRTRFLRGKNDCGSPAQHIRDAADDYHISMWANQRVRIEVWIEKDALVGVIEDVCDRYDVDYFACRGYVSQSELYMAGQRANYYHRERGQRTLIIHLGDHDPSGIDMTRDNEERLDLFSGGRTDVRRIALNEDQVRKYNPPPNPAKLTDSRASDYIRNFGHHSWELDALEPRTLSRLIEETIWEYRDPDLWEEREQELERHKALLDDAAKWMADKELG